MKEPIAERAHAASPPALRVVGASTAKGARAAEAILEATLRCLAREGYAATSLQRIADEAGVQKRMVHYYYESREALFDHVVRRVGDRLIEQVEEAIRGVEDPAEIVAVGIGRLWAGVTSDRGLLVAYFGLLSESVTDPRLREAVTYIDNGYRELIRRLVRELRSRGRAMRLDEDVLTTLIIATMRGLTLELLAEGDSQRLRDSVAEFQRRLATLSD
jgi:AcrR family transcriptional regulator